MVTPRSTATWPSSGASAPVIIRNSVVLPDPLGPTRPIFSPFWSAAEASMKRIWWPFCLEILSRRIMSMRARKNVFGAALKPCRAPAEGCRRHDNGPADLKSANLQTVHQPGIDQKPVEAAGFRAVPAGVEQTLAAKHDAFLLLERG